MNHHNAQSIAVRGRRLVSAMPSRGVGVGREAERSVEESGGADDAGGESLEQIITSPHCGMNRDAPLICDDANAASPATAG